MRRALAALAILVGCGPVAKGPSSPGEGGVRAAALPYKILRAEGGSEVPRETFFAELAAADAVCIGESHRNPHHHWAQLAVVEALGAAKSPRHLGLGMEMFQRPFQGVLDDYAAGTIDDGALLARSGWAERWGFDWDLYRPIVRAALDAGAALVALNVEDELRKKVSQNGVSGLSEADRAKVPELVLDDARHRAWWDAAMGDMGGAVGHQSRSEEGEGEAPEPASAPEHGEALPPDHGEHAPEMPDDEIHAHLKAEEPAAESKAERIYSVQVLWDETMADSAARWLQAGPGRQMIILAGNGHCHESGIVSRLERRGVNQVVSVRPVLADGSGELSSLLAEPENDYLFVMQLPAGADE